MFVKWKEMILINKLKYHCCIVLVIIISVSTPIHCSPLSPLQSTHTSIISFPPSSSIQWQNKYSLSYGDLARSYATHAQSAVGITVPHSNANFVGKKILPKKIHHNSDDLLVPNEVYNYNQPIGAYQYTDSGGDLHVVTYVNSMTGLKILNDYKPYQPYKLASVANNQYNTLSKPPPQVKVETDKVRNYNDKTTATNNNNNGNTGSQQTTRTLPAVSASNDNENIDWDEIEFTFAPQVKASTAANVSQSNHKNNYDLGRAETTNENFRITNNNGNQKKKKLPANSVGITSSNNNNSGAKSLTELLLKVRDSIPLPKPFTPIDPREPPVFLQRPDKDNRNWRGPVIPQSILYGIPLKDSAVDLGPQPFPPFFNWNKYNIN